MAADKEMNSVASNIRLIKLLTEVSNKDPENSFLLNLYKRHGKYTPESLVQEIREDASNTLLRPFKGSPNYDEVVRLVAEKMGIKKQDLSDDEATNEILIIQKMLQDYIKKNPVAEGNLAVLAKELGKNQTNFVSILKMNSKSGVFAALATIAGLGPALVAPAIMAGPAYRKIVPSVIDIAVLRLQQKQDSTAA